MSIALDDDHSVPSSPPPKPSATYAPIKPATNASVGTSGRWSCAASAAIAT